MTVYNRRSGNHSQIFFQKINSLGDFEWNDSQISNATIQFLFIFIWNVILYSANCPKVSCHSDYSFTVVWHEYEVISDCDIWWAQYFSNLTLNGYLFRINDEYTNS